MKLRITLPIALLAAMAAVVLPQHDVHGQAGAKTVEVTAKKFSFEPAEITLKKGQLVTLTLKSEDVPHGLRIRDLNVDIKAPKGSTGQATFTPDKTGDFTGHCSTFCGSGHGSMALTVHVTE